MGEAGEKTFFTSYLYLLTPNIPWFPKQGSLLPLFIWVWFSMSLAKLVATHCLPWSTASTLYLDFIFPRPSDFTVEALHRSPNSCQLTGGEKPQSGSRSGFSLNGEYCCLWPTQATLWNIRQMEFNGIKPHYLKYFTDSSETDTGVSCSVKMTVSENTVCSGILFPCTLYCNWKILLI